MKTITIFEIGKHYDTADITKVFSSMEKAMAHIPEGFEKIDVGGYDYYAENKEKCEWLSIKSYEVDK